MIIGVHERFGRSPGSGPSAFGYLGLVCLVFVLSTLSAVADTVDFVEGGNGYASTVDTLLQNDFSNAVTNRGAEPFTGWKGDDSAIAGADAHALIRFDDIIGPGVGQIPAGALITEAKLYITVFDAGGAGDVHEVLVDWDDADTYSSFCGVSCKEGLQHGPAVAEAVAETLGEIEIDVTASVQAWADGAANFGWIIRPRTQNSQGDDDGVYFRSSEVDVVVERPRLYVLFDCPPDTDVTLSLPHVTTTPGATVFVQLTTTSLDGFGVLAFDLTIEYDPAVAKFESMTTTPLIPPTWGFFYNEPTPGTILVALYGTSPLSGIGPMLNIEFSAIGDFGDLTPLDLTRALINEGMVVTCMIDGSIFICSDIDGDGDGVSQCDGDCDDTNNQQFPGNPEVCDGLDNNCDGATDEGFPNTDGDAMADCVDPDDDNDGVPDVADCAPLDDTAWNFPTEVAGVELHGGTPTQLSWNDQGTGFRYDVAGGFVVDIIQDQGTSGALCLADDEALASFADARQDPVSGEAYYYLIRSQNTCGAGTYGLATSGAPRLPVADCP
jgi:hypothetical protein